jgi:hypothetical protein
MGYKKITEDQVVAIAMKIWFSLMLRICIIQFIFCLIFSNCGTTTTYIPTIFKGVFSGEWVALYI